LIGTAKLHKSFQKFIKATDDYITKIDAAMKEIEDEAVLLFKSGW
jgi:ribosome recycling factor